MNIHLREGEIDTLGRQFFVESFVEVIENAPVVILESPRSHFQIDTRLGKLIHFHCRRAIHLLCTEQLRRRGKVFYLRQTRTMFAVEETRQTSAGLLFLLLVCKLTASFFYLQLLTFLKSSSRYCLTMRSSDSMISSMALRATST